MRSIILSSFIVAAFAITGCAAGVTDPLGNSQEQDLTGSKAETPSIAQEKNGIAKEASNAAISTKAAEKLGEFRAAPSKMLGEEKLAELKALGEEKALAGKAAGEKIGDIDEVAEGDAPYQHQRRLGVEVDGRFREPGTIEQRFNDIPRVVLHEDPQPVRSPSVEDDNASDVGLDGQGR